MTIDKLPEWVMVPREPTGDMLSEAYSALASGVFPDSFARSRAVWSAMLAAAPPREVVVDEDARMLKRFAGNGHLCPPGIAGAINRVLTAAFSYPKGV